MHTEIEKENKTVWPEDSTVKLNTSLFLLGLENALKTRKQNNQTNKKQNTNLTKVTYVPRSEGLEVSVGQVYELRGSLDISLPKVKKSKKKKASNQSRTNTLLCYCTGQSREFLHTRLPHPPISHSLTILKVWVAFVSTVRSISRRLLIPFTIFLWGRQKKKKKKKP